MQAFVQTPRRATRPPALTVLALTAGLALLAHVPAHAQDLNGQPVQVTQRVPDAGTVILDAGTQTVTPAGASFTTGTAFMTVTPGQIVFTFASNVAGLGAAPFNGFRIAETGGSPAAITGVSLDPSSNLAGFDASRISFDATDVSANFQNLFSFEPDSKVTLDLSFAPAAVPEPSPALTFAVAGLGLLGLTLRARKRKVIAA